MPDGSTRGPVTLSGTSATVYTLEALVDTEGTLSTDFDLCVGAWVKPSADTYWNIALDKSLTAVGGTPSTSSLTVWKAGQTYTLGSAIGDLAGVETAVTALAAAVDTSASRVMTQERGTFTNLTADGIAYSGPCVLRRVVVNTGAAGSVVVYDNTSAAGTKVATINGANPGVFDYGCTVSNGVYIDLAAGQDVTVIVEPV